MIDNEAESRSRFWLPLGEDDMEQQVITLVVSVSEHRMLLDALDKKIWSLEQTGLSGAYRLVPAYRQLRAEIADVRHRASA